MRKDKHLIINTETKSPMLKIFDFYELAEYIAKTEHRLIYTFKSLEIYDRNGNEIYSCDMVEINENSIISTREININDKEELSKIEPMNIKLIGSSIDIYDLVKRRLDY